jgi:hypothetical protein
VEGFAANAAAHPAGSAVISWTEPQRTTMADSGTIVGGFGTQVVIDGAAAASSSSWTGVHAPGHGDNSGGGGRGCF